MTDTKAPMEGNGEQAEWIKTCTEKISNVIGGGSELFVRHGDIFRLDVDFICKRISEMRERHHDAMHRAIRAERALKDAQSASRPQQASDDEGRDILSPLPVSPRSALIGGDS